MNKKTTAQGHGRALYASPRTEVMTMMADASILQASGGYGSEALDPLTDVDLGDIWG